MKSFAFLALLSLASAQVNVAPPVVQSGTFDPNALNSSSLLNSSDISVGGQGLEGQNLNGQEINGQDLSGLNLNDQGLGGLDLNNINLGGLNLGSVDLSNQNDIVNAILEMMALLCMSNVFDVNSLSSLGQEGDLELFLELAQLMQLELLGFLNVGGIQSLLLSGFGSNNLNLFNGENLSGLSGLNNFDLGSFKRSVDESKKTMKRIKLRRSATYKRQSNCQAAAVQGVSAPPAVASVAPAAVAPAAATVAPAVTSAAAAVAPPAVATVAPAVETAAAAPAAVASAAPASSGSGDDENLSDFTR